jgi:hypothetical protein
VTEDDLPASAAEALDNFSSKDPHVQVMDVNVVRDAMLIMHLLNETNLF